ncbi:MAG: nitrous oxide-stimulated promoter family protein [Candidatus Saccharimonadaceae bacterium]
MKNMNEEEKKVVNKMITLYCKSNHKTKNGLCMSCKELNDYAFARLDRCPFGDNKPTCGSCTIHCYKSEKKEQIKKVMQFAGPRMLLLSPIYTILHFYKEYKRNRLFG